MEIDDATETGGSIDEATASDVDAGAVNRRLERHRTDPGGRDRAGMAVHLQRASAGRCHTAGDPELTAGGEVAHVDGEIFVSGAGPTGGSTLYDDLSAGNCQ